MLVLTMYTDQQTVLYTEDGIEIGSIEILDVQGNKAKVAFRMRDDVAVAREGISKETALSLLQKSRRNNHENRR